MKLKLKEYKVDKIKSYLKFTQLFFVFHGVNLTIKDWISIKQTLKELKSVHYSITNNLVKKVLTKSTLVNLKIVVKGPCFFIKLFSYNNKILLILKNLIDFTPLLTFFCLKINNKFYTLEQLDNFKALNYLISIKNLHYFLQRYVYTLFQRFFQ